MTDSELHYEVKNQAAWMTIDREYRRNALSVEVIDKFHEYLDRAEADEQVRLVVITGAGEKAFCSGADLASAMASGGTPLDATRKYAGLLKKMAAFPKPLLARVNGHCLAGGLGLMLSCDMVYAREGSKFGTPEVKVGLFPMMIGALIFRNARRKKALEMIYTARMYSAAEAEDMGLITRAYAAEELDPAVDGTIADIADRGPLAIKVGRKALAEVEDMDLGDALDHLCDQLAVLMQSEDAAEGLTAFLEKRKPEWKGR